MAKVILRDEMNLTMAKKRVLFKNTYYPLNFIVFENDKMLGSYDPIIYQIGLNKGLMFEHDNQTIKNILRHELAHFFTHINFGVKAQAHGVEFRSVFELFNWDKSFSKSQIDLSKLLSQTTHENKVLQKIKKLLSLANSPNENEARLATKKANELIIKHNLQSLQPEEEHESYVSRVLHFKRKNPKHDGIYEIIKNFHVYPVFNQGSGGGYLEVVGSKTNVQIAEYVVQYLDQSIDAIWSETKKENKSLKGVVAKNSFIRSFCQTVSQTLKEQTYYEEQKVDSKELMAIKADLSLRVQRVYPNLRTSYSKGHKEDRYAKGLGNKKGKDFKIRPGISEKSQKRGILSWLK